MRVLLIGLGGSAATFVVSSLALAVLDLYLAGHGRTSPMQQAFISRGAIQLSVADAVVLGLSVVVGAISMAWYARHR